jgi:hypothetical protein
MNIYECDTPLSCGHTYYYIESQPITHTNLPSFIPLYLQAYVNRYANGAVLEHTPSDEEIVRIHKGGPGGHNDPATLSFWNSVAAYLIS